jgi:hypothetical protein
MQRHEFIEPDARLIVGDGQRPATKDEGRHVSNEVCAARPIEASQRDRHASLERAREAHNAV